MIVTRAPGYGPRLFKRQGQWDLLGETEALQNRYSTLDNSVTVISDTGVLLENIVEFSMDFAR